MHGMFMLAYLRVPCLRAQTCKYLLERVAGVCASFWTYKKEDKLLPQANAVRKICKKLL